MGFKYSVIIPHYNSEAELRRLLQSIPNDESIEVIVVDDRSDTEGFLEVISQSALDFISVYVNKGVKGAGAARNIGLDKAKGQYLIFADSDDFFTKSAFRIIDNSVDLEDGQVDVFFFNVTSQKDNGDIGIRHINISTLVSDYSKKKGRYYEEMIRFSHNGPVGKVIRRDFVRINDIRFDETIVSNDAIFSLKVGKYAGNIKVIDRVVYCITQTGVSLTRQRNVDFYRIRLEVFIRYYNFLTSEERRKIKASPLPILISSKKYGLREFFRSVVFLNKSGVSIFGNFPISIKRAKMLFFRIIK